MPNDERDQRFLRFARAIALVSGVAIPLGATVPACAEEQLPPTDAGLAFDGGAYIDAGITVDTPPPGLRIDDVPATRDAGITVDVPPPGLRIDDVPAIDDTPDAAAPTDAATGDAAANDAAGPLMPPAFDDELA